MNDLVQRNEKGIAITNSLLVAEKFEKDHKHVIASIRELLQSAENSSDCKVRNIKDMFYESEYLDARNRSQVLFIMNRDGFSLLTMGYTGEKALRFKVEFIDAFNKMEAALLDKHTTIERISKSDLARMVLESEEEKARIQLQLEEEQEVNRTNAPKVQFAESFKASTTIYLMRDLAKYINQNICKMGEVRLYEWMVENKYLIKSKRWSNSKQKYVYDYMPTQRASDMKIFHIVPTHINSGSGDYLFTKNTVKLTSKGQTYFINKFLELNKQAI